MTGTISLSGIEVVQNGARVLGPLALDLPVDGITVLLGPNGAGKTTLLRVIHGLERATIGTLDMPDLAQGFVFQKPVLLRRTALANVAYPLRLRGAMPEAAAKKAQAALDEVGLGGAARQRAASLSGGEQQRLALARALVTRPDLLLLDEPTASLDGQATESIEGSLGAARARGTGILLATHDLGQARRLADRVVFLLHGRALETGTADGFFGDPRSSEARAFLAGKIVP
ncbi:MAG: ATP-binding cassette domain-containing protein [Pseudomonadota bacterium]